MISLIVIIPDESDPDPLTLKESLLADIVLLSIWFIISFVIALIINELKKIKPKIIKEVQYITKPNDKVIAKNDEIKEKIIKETKSEPKKKYLYTCENIINAHEYKKMTKYFPKRIYWVFVIRGLFLNLIFSVIIAITSKSLIGTLIFFVIYQLFLMILYKVRLEHFAEKTFNTMQKKIISIPISILSFIMIIL